MKITLAYLLFIYMISGCVCQVHCVGSSLIMKITEAYLLFIYMISGCVCQVHRVGSSLIMKITLAYLFFTMLLYSLIVFGLIGPEFDNVKGTCQMTLFTVVTKVG
jgi:hypothetical protein